MSLDATAVQIAKRGHIYVAPPNTPYPATPLAPAAPWVEVGHTSEESPLTVTRDGGDRTTKGTWQADAVRETVAAITYGLEWTLLQQDELCLGLYYGGGEVDVDDRFIVPLNPAAQEKAVFLRVIDGAKEWPRWFPIVSIIGSDNEEMDREEFTGLPVAGTILTPDGATLDGLFAIQL